MTTPKEFFEKVIDIISEAYVPMKKSSIPQEVFDDVFDNGAQTINKFYTEVRNEQ